MMRVRRALPLLLLSLIAAGTLASCGGGGGDFSGDPDVPDGYKTFETTGISFAYPGDWQVEERTDADGAPAVQITPPDKAKTPFGLIQLTVSPDAGDRFESIVDQTRIVVREVNDGEIESDEEVELPGAERALRSTTVTPAGRGTDPVEVRSDGLDVLRDNGDVIGFTVAVPQRDGEDLDPAPIVDTLRLAD